MLSSTTGEFKTGARPSLPKYGQRLILDAGSFSALT